MALSVICSISSCSTTSPVDIPVYATPTFTIPTKPILLCEKLKKTDTPMTVMKDMNVDMITLMDDDDKLRYLLGSLLSATSPPTASLD